MRRRFIPLTVLCVVALGMTLPASAGHTSAHATDEIAAVAAQGLQDMDDVVAGFEQATAGMATAGEVEAGAEASEANIDAIWTAAKTQIEALVKLYPGQLGAAGGSAKQQLQARRHESRDTISSLTDAWAPAAPTTTSTSTTTTTAPATTTTTGDSAPGNSGNTPPGQGSGSGPPTTPGSAGRGNQPAETGKGQTPSPTSLPASPTPSGEHAREAPATATPPGSLADNMLILATQTPVQSVLAAPNGPRDLVETGESPATQRVAAALDTVLPPALVDLVLSPLVVLEILMRTVMDGGARVIGPLTLLAGCAFAMFAYDRSSRRKPKWVRNRSEVQR